MRVTCVLIILAFAFCTAHAQQPNPQKKVIYLSIVQNKITKARDTTVFWGKKHYWYATVPVKLFNLSDDKLSYFTMTCSTFEIFTTNNKNVEVELQPCQHNVPTLSTVLSHQSSITNINLFFSKNAKDDVLRFKIGMYLCRYPQMDESKFFEYLVHSSWPKNLLIWSNEVVITN